MPLAEDLIRYLDPLVSESMDGPAPSLMEGPIGEKPDVCVALTVTAGELPEWTMGPEYSEPDMEIGHVQLMVRHTTMAGAISKAFEYHRLLRNMGPRSLSGRLYFDVQSMDGEPYSLGQDQNERWRRVANYRVRKISG